MAAFFVDANDATNGIRISLFADEDFLLASGIEVASFDDSALVAAAGQASLALSPDSSLVGFGDPAAVLLNGTTSEFSLSIAEGAQIYGKNVAVEVQGEILLSNRGTVIGYQSEALVIDDRAVITNYGVIESLTDDAIRLGDLSTITNHGSIIGSGEAIRADERIDLYNYGLIRAEDAISIDDPVASDGVANIFNAGTITSEFRTIEIDDMNLSLVNTGVISTTRDNDSDAALDLDNSDPMGEFLIKNSGRIIGELAIEIVDGRATITNTGEIIGDVVFADENNSYLGAKGSIEGGVFGGTLSDLIVGGGEDNMIVGDEGADILRGRGGDDEIFGGAGFDVLNGGAGDDQLFGGSDPNAGDVLRGKAGDDTLITGDGADLLIGNAGDDSLSGGAGGDDLRGNAGDDSLGGGRGADTLIGGKGDDELTGGQFTDTFVIRRRDGEDVITDFADGADVIDLQAFGFFSGQFNAEVLPALSSAGNGNSFLDLDVMGGNGSVLIRGLKFADADASDFIL